MRQWPHCMDLKQNKTLVFVLLGAAFLILAIFLWSRLGSVLSGEFDINGVIPEGATVTVMVQAEGSNGYTPVASGLPAVDGTNWKWTNATRGTTYSVKAQLMQGGKAYGDSQTAQLVAPTRREVLVINSDYRSSNNTPQYGPISGTIDLNGAVGPQSNVTLYQKKTSEENFTEITNQIQAVDGAAWKWGGAVSGEDYEMKATLFVNGQASGTSQIITVTSPASNEVLKINSTYQAPPEQVSISGTVVINGPIPSNSTVTIYAQGPNDKSPVSVISGLAANETTSWNWTKATQGYTYTMSASVMQNGNDQGDSQTITVTAPASNEVLIVTLGKAGGPTVQPPNSPTAQCVSQNNGQWTVNLNYQSVNGANSYWIQVGSNYKASDILNTFVRWSGTGTQTYSLNTINNGTTYYAQYATSTCSTCTSSSQFSPFSNVLTFSCSNAPSPTPTAKPTVQPTYTPTPTLVPPTATPTLPPNTSACNQTCGSNGYSCAVGLECVTGAAPGSQVCRNPNCTDKASCSCI